MSSQRGRQISVEERHEREQAWLVEQKKREKAWTAEFEKRQKVLEAEDRERRHVTSIAAERAAWAEGKRAGSVGFIDVTGPDEVPVRIAVMWLGRFRATRKPLNDYDPFRHVDGTGGGGDGLILLVLYTVLIGLNSGLRWLVLRLADRPRWAVAAAMGPDRGKGGPNNIVLLRSRSRRRALRSAAALADRVEQDGTAALTPAALTPR
ncbi:MULTISPECIES: hypothetical protein [unclassified Kitasatospora]|uniref:hypothetical protein n=1 Tax=unclassified Kitasatospora TaxID=2633591 RepID=UPI003404DC0F